MPIERCSLSGRPGYRWGEKGKCYTYESGNEHSRWQARARAMKQGRAIQARRGVSGSVGCEVIGGGGYTFEYARWNLGDARISSLVEFFNRAWDERVTAARQEFLFVPRALTRFDAEVKSAHDVMQAEIATWTDETKSPVDETGALIVDGSTPKMRLEQWILTAVDRAVTLILQVARAESVPLSLGPQVQMSPVQQVAIESWKLDPRTWKDRWAWFEESMQQARVELEAILPPRVVPEIDWDMVFAQAAEEIDMMTMDPSSCGCQLFNGALLKILQLYGYQGANILGADELTLLTRTMQCMVGEDLGKPWWEWGTE